MKHSVFMKFIALALCAAFLLTAAGSGVAALCLTEMGLYEQTVDQLYDESRYQLTEVFANQIATNYASQTLGGCPEEMVDNYVYFNAGYYGYALKDAAGNVLKERQLENTAGGAKTYTFTVQESYMKLVESIPESELYAATEPVIHDGLHVIDNRPGNDVLVDEITLVHSSGIEYGYVVKILGILYHTSTGEVFFQAHDPDIRLHSGEIVTQASFFSNGELVYQITCSDGVGEFSVDENGLLSIVFQHQESAEGTEPPLADSATEPVMENPTEAPETETVPPTEPPLVTGVTEPLTENPTKNTQYPIVGPSYSLTNNIPDEGASVLKVSYVSSYGQHDFSIGNQTGFLSYNADGAVIFHTTSPSPVRPEGDTFYYIAFYGTDGTLLYEANNPGGVGSFYLDEENYMHFTSWMETANVPTEDIPSETTAPVVYETAITDNIERLGSKVSTITIVDRDGRTHTIDPGVPQGKAFAYLFRNDQGTVTCRSYDPMTLVAIPESIYIISFLDSEGRPLYAVQSGEGVGHFLTDSNGHMRFVTNVIPEPDYTEPDTIPDTTTATEVVDTPVSIPQETVIAELTEPTEVPVEISENSTFIHYYDSALGEPVQAKIIYEDMPEPYTVEISLAPGAYEMDPVYDLIQWIWQYRNQLLYVLAASLLGFAVTAVYLCCAAGRKPGREEVRAEGINCLSLDVYLAGGIGIICILAVLGFEGGYYLLRYSPQILAPFAILMGYAAALIIVAFCFACAAQFKTPGGYWWRNTLTVRCAKLGMQFLGWSAKAFIRFMRWLEVFLGKCFPRLGKIIVVSWNGFLQLCIAVYQYTEKGLTWLGHFLGRIFRKAFAWCHRFLVMLPVTWQWLITGGMLLFVLVMALATRSEGFFLLAVLAGIALVVYGSHCFGVLLESTKHMSKGDLETKVDDKLMVGSFKEFAGDLNALADVAVVAAQKQLKSERMKTELITNVSHDIKTPLTSIINYVDLLQKPHTDEEQEAYLEVLSRQSQRMKKLLEDLLEMSKASTGNMTVNIIRLNAAEAVTQALGEFSDKLEKAQLTTVLQQPQEPVYIQADGRLTWRVLSNLLSNTVKYALPGTRVYIDVVELDGKVLISLKNISREALNVSAEELMERFVRGDASRNTEGSGLGLNIAQSLMEIQKGSLQLLVDGDLFKVTLIFPGATE